MKTILTLILAAGIAPAASFTPTFDSGEIPVETILDSLFGGGNYTRISDDIDQVWTGNVTLTAMAMSSQAAATQQLGVCVLCDGSDDTLLGPSIGPELGVFFNVALGSTVISDPLFRFFNAATGFDGVGRVNSDPAMNPGGFDHLLSFELSGQPNTYVLAFEDWFFTADPPSDGDYNDFVVKVMFEPVAEVPEPGTMALLGAGLLLALRLRRKR